MYEDLSTITIVKLRDPKCTMQKKAEAVLSDLKTLHLDPRYINLIEHHTNSNITLCQKLLDQGGDKQAVRRLGELTISTVAECNYADFTYVWKLITSLISTHSRLYDMQRAAVKNNTTPHRMTGNIDRSFSDMVKARQRLKAATRRTLSHIPAPPPASIG